MRRRDEPFHFRVEAGPTAEVTDSVRREVLDVAANIGQRRGVDCHFTAQRHSRPQIVVLDESHLLVEAAELAHERKLGHDRRRRDLRIDSQHLLQD